MKKEREAKHCYAGQDDNSNHDHRRKRDSGAGLGGMVGRH